MGEAERGVERAAARAGRGGARRLQRILDAAHGAAEVAAVRRRPSRRYRRPARRRAHRRRARNRRPAPAGPTPSAAACALMRAFSTKVVPVSSGSGRPSSPAETRSSPNGVEQLAEFARACRHCGWRAPAGRRGAMTEACRHGAERRLLQGDEFGDALFGQRHQRLRVRRG